MNQFKQNLLVPGLVALLATGALAITSPTPVAAADTKMPAGMEMPGDMQMPKTAADFNAAAAKYDGEAAELDAKAAEHAKMGARYRGIGGGGSKQGTAFVGLANHCERLADTYRKAALEARAAAQMCRDMAKMA